jgi:hypothetical protein
MITQPSPRVAALLEKMRHARRGRLIFALDATGSREAAWDLAAKLQVQMFEEAAKIGGLDIQLVHFRGDDEVQSSAWLSDARELVDQMHQIRCLTGATQIARILEHVRTEHTREKVDAAIFVGDAVEEMPQKLYDAATDLGVPVFMFQEGFNSVIYHDHRGEPAGGQPVEDVFREIARLTNGAYGKFDAGAARQLGELLRAVAAFAIGGIAALVNQNTESARKLLGQLK